jgi:uncharacterized protein YutE (UPF0331/DUF86 family)
MADILERVKAEEENVGKALKALFDVMGCEDLSIVELAASATFIHNVYGGIENILKQVLKEEGVTIAQTGSWHKELLNKAVSKEVITEKTSSELAKYLAFRHFFVHGYGFNLKEEPIRDLGTKLPGVWSVFIKEIKEHLKTDDKRCLREKAVRYSAKRKIKTKYVKKAKGIKKEKAISPGTVAEMRKRYTK